MFLTRLALRGYVASGVARKFEIRVATTCRREFLYYQSRVLKGFAARLKWDYSWYPRCIPSNARGGVYVFTAVSHIPNKRLT